LGFYWVFVSSDSSSLIQLFGIFEAKFIFSFELGRMFEIGTDIQMVQKESTIVVELKEPHEFSQFEPPGRTTIWGSSQVEP
jgi:hypothetical protein